MWHKYSGIDKIRFAVILATFSFISSQSLHAQLYCQSWNGVNVRDSTTLDSEIIGKIKFGDKIENYKNTKHEILDDRSGIWLKINYNGEVGYVYSAFFGTQKITLMDSETEFVDYLIAMLDLYIEDSIAYSISHLDDVVDGLSDKHFYNTYIDGAISYTHFGYEYEKKSFITDRISPNEFLNILNTYYHMSGNKSRYKPIHKSGFIGKGNYMTYEICIDEVSCIFRHIEGVFSITVSFNDYPTHEYWCDFQDYEVVEEINKECLTPGKSNVKKFELVRINKSSRGLILVATVQSGGNTYRDAFYREIKHCKETNKPLYRILRPANSDGKCKLEFYNYDCTPYNPIYDNGWKIMD